MAARRNPASRPHVEPVLYQLDDAGAALGVSRNTIYRLIDAGEIEAVHIGRDLRVVPDSLIAYRERLRAAERPTRAITRPTRAVRPETPGVIHLRG